MKEKDGTLTLGGVVGRDSGAARLIGGGKYVLSGTPRSGGIACVYRAIDVETSTHVALKMFRPVSGTDSVIEESFRREVQALSTLRHENIIRILSSGYESKTGEHYIAMEWVPRDLEVLRKERQFSDWGQYFGQVGRQVLQALAFAHSNAVVHRDVKPSNILITQEGLVKVCDFGISKIRNFLEPGVTLAHFASVPYAPPEQDDGTYSYSRDVFGFAALSVTMLSPSAPSTHAELLVMLDGIQIDAPVKRMLRRCLSMDNPGERPANAVSLLSEFERLQPLRKEPTRGGILLTLTKNVRDIVTYDTGVSGEDAVNRFVLNDLKDAACQYDAAPRAALDAVVGERSIRLYGERYGYVAIRDGGQAQRLKLVSAADLPPSEMERNRENSLPCPFSLAVLDVPQLDSANNISELRTRLDDFVANQKLFQIQQAQQQLFKTWLDLLSAKTELENSKRREFRYGSFTQSGGVVEFQISAGADVAFLEDKDIRIQLREGDFLGNVVGSTKTGLRVQPSVRSSISIGALPAEGSFTVDTARADAALDKQKAAIDAVRYGRSADPFLGNYIVDPASIPVAPIPDLEFIQQKIDEDKKNAVRTAMSEPPLMIVEGPPGTGKTTFITELILQVLKSNPAARILLSSQTHVALDNSLERIGKEGGGTVRAVRIGHDGDEKISATTRNLLVDRKLPAMRKEAIATGRQFVEDWAGKHGVDLVSTRMAMALGRRAGLKLRHEEVAVQIASLRPILEQSSRGPAPPNTQQSQSPESPPSPEERADLEDQLSALVMEQEALDRDLKESLTELRKHEADKETIQHFADCSSSDLRSWSDTYAPQSPEGVQLRKMLAAHSDWETRFGRSREFKAALIASSQVVAGTCLGVMGIPGRNDITYDVCIVDEASIATPTEVLVPMARARRTVLVGDNRQLSPFQDPELKSKGLLKKFNIDPQDQGRTLFRHLSENLPEEFRRSLSTQHRMLPDIGNLISECFYDGGLFSIVRAADAALSSVLPHAVTWRSTSRLPNRGSKTVGTSHYNNLEVELIERLLVKLDFEIQHGKHSAARRSLAVLTGYGEQKKRLQTAIDTRRHTWKSFSDIYVNVVDAFQGREADIAVFSVTRSEVDGLGFLRDMERINVALSRSRERLVIVGDHSHFQQATDGTNPLKQVIDYMRRNPATCLIEEVVP